MKKYYFCFIICCLFFADIHSQEIRIKRRPFMPQPAEYYSGNEFIGNSTQELAYFIETHSQDSLVIQQIKSSEKLTKIYPKIYLYSSITTGIGGIGLGYVVFKGVGSIFNPKNANPSLATVVKTSLGFMIVGITGLTVAGGYFVASQIKLHKAIKGYNRPFQADKVTLDFHPYLQSDSYGLTATLNF